MGRVTASFVAAVVAPLNDRDPAAFSAVDITDRNFTREFTTAQRYLDRRGLDRPTIDWAAVRELRTRVGREQRGNAR